jgi:hypothetical protein
MASKLKRIALRPIPYIFSDRVGTTIAKLFSRSLSKQITARVTNDFVKLLLRGMDLSFCLSRGYRKNIEDFKGTYLFRTQHDEVVVAATFDGGNMQVHEKDVGRPDVRVTFKDPEALRSFLLSTDRDVINSVLENKVEVEGNLNCIYKFGFMVTDLAKRLGVLPMMVPGAA